MFLLAKIQGLSFNNKMECRNYETMDAFRIAGIGRSGAGARCLGGRTDTSACRPNPACGFGLQP